MVRNAERYKGCIASFDVAAGRIRNPADEFNQRRRPNVQFQAIFPLRPLA
jgi:hypothetical protein